MDAWAEDSDAGFELPDSLEALLSELPDHLPELIVLLDEDGVVLWLNDTSEAVLGWPRAEWIGQNVLKVLHPDDVALAGELLVSARATGSGTKEPVRYRIASAFADWLTIDAVASTVELATGRTVLVMSARVTGRARQQEFIAGEVEERASVAFEHAVVGMARVGLDGRVLQVNPAFADRVGATTAELHGVSLVGLVAPADRPVVAGALSACAEGSGPTAVGAGVGVAPAPAWLHLSLVPDWVGDPLYVFVQVTDRSDAGGGAPGSGAPSPPPGS